MKVQILGVDIDVITFDAAVGRIEAFLGDGKKHLVTTPYSESIVDAQADAEFRRIINEADLAVPDGGGLLAAAEFLSYPLPQNKMQKIFLALIYGLISGLKLAFAPKTFGRVKERVSGTDLVVSLAEMSAAKGYKIFFLGGRGGVASQAAEILKVRYPGLKVEAQPGPPNILKADRQEIADIINYINAFSPDLLFVAFKPVLQEKWLAENMERIEAEVFMAVGGAFDMISGRTPRAPRLLRRLNLEWLWRLILEPSRIGRISRAIIIFPWLVFREKLS